MANEQRPDLTPMAGEPSQKRAQPEHTAPSTAKTGGTHTVGMLLRAARLRSGGDIAALADMLKIRASYLEAIEAGRWQDMPGRAYAMGFVRAYAEELGLDGDEAVRRFKLEMSASTGAEELVFRSPVSEGKVPGGALLVMSVLLAGAVYGGWYYLTSKERKSAEPLIAAAEKLPPPLQMEAPKPAPQPSLTRPEPAPSSPAAATIANSLPSSPPLETTPPPEGDDDETQNGQIAPNSQIQTGQTKIPAVPPTSLPPKAGEILTGKLAGAPPAATAPLQAQVPVQMPAAPPAMPVVQAPPPPANVAAPIPDSTATPPIDTGLPPGRTFGAPTIGRVTVRAKSESWVQVKDSKDTVWLTRVLQPGDRYNVPDDRDDLTLTTGNAPGLLVIVDGAQAPGLAKLHRAKNGFLSLNANKLLAGTAIGSKPSDEEVKSKQSGKKKHTHTTHRHRSSESGDNGSGNGSGSGSLPPAPAPAPAPGPTE